MAGTSFGGPPALAAVAHFTVVAIAERAAVAGVALALQVFAAAPGLLTATSLRDVAASSGQGLVAVGAPATTAVEVVRQIWVVALGAVAANSFLGGAETLLCGMLEAVTAHLFPASYVTRRHDWEAERLLGTLFQALSLVRLRARRGGRAARRARAILPGPLAQALASPGPLSLEDARRVGDWVRLQAAVTMGELGEEEDVLYFFMGEFLYAGRAKAQRAARGRRPALEGAEPRRPRGPARPPTPGPLVRLLEHLESRFRPFLERARRSGHAWRYRVWRRVALSRVSWAVAVRAPWKLIHALETATIREVRPEGNDTVPQEPQGLPRARGRARGRPPQWVRRRCPVLRAEAASREDPRAGRLRRAEAAARRDPRVARGPPALSDAPWWAYGGFREAYSTVLLRGEEEGPLDVRDPGRRFLFLLWVAERGSEVRCKEVEEA